MKKLSFILLLLVLTACGGAAQPTTTNQAGSTTAKTATPTSAELAQLKTVASRLALMHRAAQQLQQLSTATGVSLTSWRASVVTQASIVSSGRQAIDRATIPERYQTPRLAEILSGCTTMAAAISTADVKRSDLINNQGLVRCANGLEQMAFVYSEYTQ